MGNDLSVESLFHLQFQQGALWRVVGAHGGAGSGGSRGPSVLTPAFSCSPARLLFPFFLTSFPASPSAADRRRSHLQELGVPSCWQAGRGSEWRRPPGFESQLCHSPATVGHWAQRDFTSLCLSFSTCKMGTKSMSISSGYWGTSLPSNLAVLKVGPGALDPELFS